MSDYLENTRTVFNNIAGSYDELDNQNPILKWMRKVVYKIYLTNFRPGSKLLELNAGTGIDAVYLAAHGLDVLATDISPKMLTVLDNKIKSGTLGNNIRTLLKSFEQICSIDENDFDGVISNFGGLNCIPDFTDLSRDLFLKLKPGGIFVAVVINKICPWEIIYYLIKFDAKTAFRRFTRGGIDANLNGEKIRTFYFTPKEFAEFFMKEFIVEKIYSHGLYTPPPYLTGIYDKLKPIVKILMKIDEITKGIFPFNRFGDHFIIVMRKK